MGPATDMLEDQWKRSNPARTGRLGSFYELGCQSALKNDPLSASKTDPLYSRSYAWLCDERAPERQETWRRRPLSIEGAMIVLAPAPALFEGLRIVAVKTPSCKGF